MGGIQRAMAQQLQIDLWYGHRQSFAGHGLPQRWANVLGRVSGPKPVVTLEYALNGGEMLPLSIGPDLRRLAGKGDFNVDLDCRDLKVGENDLLIRAVDEVGDEITERVTLVNHAQPCALPYTIKWGEVAQIQDVAHVVDGIWSITADGVSPEEISYDRLIAIGDMAWRDYEVTVPITVHGINAACYNRPSVHAGVGIVLRWKGHSNWGADEWAGDQPWYGPGPYGAISWYCVFHDVGPILNFFDPDFQRTAELPRKLDLHVPYIFKTRVETLDDETSHYSLKVWRAGEDEPNTWDLTAPGSVVGLKEGAILLGAHHTAATFGDVTVEELRT